MKKYKLMFSLLFVICVSLNVLIYFKQKELDAILVNSWGLSFKASNEPNAPIDENILKSYNAYYRGEKTGNKLYLTFDCGYEAGYTSKILDILYKYNIKATFFIVGHYLNTAESLIKRIIEEGHEVANHTYHHPNMKVLDLKKLEEEIYLLEFKFNEITNSKLSKYFRPPQGVYSLEQLDKISSLGYKTIFWSLAYMDYDKDNQPSYQTALNLLKSRTHNGAIILLHNTSKTNSEILDEYIRYHLNLGYEFSLLDF